jgi:fumarate reductase flavoprotein subunit
MNEKTNQLSRRGFVKGGVLIGAATAATALMACAPQDIAGISTANDTDGIVWSGEADIIVAGGGGGLIAACDAADAGDSVILLEKGSFVGGESSLNEAWINGSGTSVQRAQGVTTDNAETQAADYAINHADHMKNIDQELLNDYCANSGASIERLIELGAEYVLDQDTVFYTTVPRAHMMQPNASAWGKTFGQAAQDRGVEIMTDTPLTDLITDTSGQIIGVKSGDKSFKARKAVILATGDISGNERMKSKYQPDWAYIEAALPTNTGDGLFAALSVGADSSFDQYTAVGPSLSFDPTGSVIAFYQTLKGLIVVNQEGKRFANEDDISTLAGTQYTQTDGTAYMVFDSRIAAISMRPDCSVSEINTKVFAGESAELGLISGMGPAYLDDYLNREEWTDTVVEAETIEGLASAFGIDAAAFA